MILFFNRKQLVSTFSTKRQIEIRTLLAQASIDYTIKVINRQSSSPFGDSRLHSGTLGQNLKLSYEYIFYVHKADFEKANFIIKN
ncbi:MAG: hypothetical protein ACERKN_09190 [Velocimicrobium sp.]